MVEELLERFSAVVSDVCACLMGFKVHLDHFLEGKINLGLKQLKAFETMVTLPTHSQTPYKLCLKSKQVHNYPKNRAPQNPLSDHVLLMQ